MKLTRKMGGRIKGTGRQGVRKVPIGQQPTPWANHGDGFPDILVWTPPFALLHSRGYFVTVRTCAADGACFLGLRLRQQDGGDPGARPQECGGQDAGLFGVRGRAWGPDRSSRRRDRQRAVGFYSTRQGPDRTIYGIPIGTLASQHLRDSNSPMPASGRVGTQSGGGKLCSRRVFKKGERA